VKPRALVVGAGLGGLSASVRLALAGFEVEVFDQAPTPGGKAAEVRLGAFRFDSGPSLVTLVEVWDELFTAAGQNRADHLPFSPLDPVAHYFWPDGAQLRAPADPGALGRAFADRGWAPEAATRSWFRRAQGLWNLAGPLFLGRSLHDPATWALPSTWATLAQAGRLDAGRPYARAVARTFADPRVRQFWGRYATYNGSDPGRLPATFAMIPWVEFGLGAWAADRGIHSIPEAMQTLAEAQGVRFHNETPVEAILHDGGRIRGLQTGGAPGPQVHGAEVVVTNADVGPSYRLLEAGGPLPRAARRRRDAYLGGEPSSSGVVFLWGVAAEHPELGLHNVFFSPDSGTEFRALFEERRLPEDPTVYVNITSKVTPGEAPPGQENWFVLVNAPHDPGPVRRVDAEAVARLRAAVLRRVEAALGRPLGPRIVEERILTPADLERTTGSPGGSLYGLASHRALAAFDRHPNRAPGFRGLYFCGGSAHPGGGMPLAVLSGRIAADLAARDFRPPH